jgi:DNA repair protein RadC
LVGLSRTLPAEWAVPSTGAARVQAALELGRRLVQAPPGARPVINSASKLAAHLLLDMRPLEQEVLKCAVLTTRLHLIKIVDVHQGTLNSNLVRIADVFREPVRLGAAAILLAHNHPSGDTTPSADDVETTRHLITAGELLGIDVLDHLIIGDTWISMRAQGLGWPPAAHVEAFPPLLNERSVLR